MNSIKAYISENGFRLALVCVIAAVCVAGGFHADAVGGVALVAPFLLGEVTVDQVKEVVEKATKEVKGTTERMQQALDQAINDVKTLQTVQGKTNDELKTASDLCKKTQDDLKGALDRLLEVEQKSARRLDLGGGQAKSWGETCAASEQYKTAVEREKKRATPEMDSVEVGSWHKTRILSSDVQTTSGTVNYLSPAERAPFVPGTERQLIVRSLIPVYQTESALIEFCRENVFTNSAGPQGAGASPQTEVEGQPKAESGITFTFEQQPVITIAHWIPASRQILADAKMLQSYIDQRLRYGVLLEEEDEVLNSTGTSGELDGLIHKATTYNRGATADSPLDTLLKAFLQVTLSDYAADGVVLNPADWTDMLLLKDSTGRYIFGDPSSMKAPAVWGRPVVPSNTITQTRFLTGAFQLAAALWDREQATVRIAEQHSDFFVRNMVVILAEERVALTVFRPAALVSGTFSHVAGQPG